MPNNNWLYDALLPKYDSLPLKHFISGPIHSIISYSDFELRIAQFANALINLGVEPDDHVMLQIEKSTDFIALYLAVVAVGAVFIPINTAYVCQEVDYFIKDSKPRLFLCDPLKIEHYKKQIDIETTQFFSLNANREGSWYDQLERIDNTKTSFNKVARNKDDIAAILYTSGTTGRSKGAMLSHDNLVSNTRALKNLWQFEKEDVLLHALPIYHTHGLFVAINLVLYSRASMVFLPKFKPSTVCETLPNCTVMMGVPTFYSRLMAAENFTKEICSSIRLFISGSAPLLAVDHMEFEKRTAKVILERYGMTETNMITSNPYDGERKAGTVGQRLNGIQVRVVSELEKSEVEVNQIGMIQVKGPNVFKGYWNMPEKTKAEFTVDGYFITGDLGELDEQGYLSIVGRDKDMVISGGLNVYPIEVETVINRCDAVVESAVVGIKDSDLGEAVIAVVVTQQLSELEKQQCGSSIEKATRENLAGFKRPKQIFFVDQLPRNSMGKVQKSALREEYQQQS